MIRLVCVASIRAEATVSGLKHTASRLELAQSSVDAPPLSLA